MSTLYKVVELSIVTDESIEQTINEWTSKGWNFDSIQFAMRDASKRPAMAFLIFTKNEPSQEKKKEEENSNPQN